MTEPNAAVAAFPRTDPGEKRFWPFTLLYLALHFVCWVPGYRAQHAPTREQRVEAIHFALDLWLWYVLIIPAVTMSFFVARALWLLVNRSSEDTHEKSYSVEYLTVSIGCTLISWYYLIPMAYIT